MKVRKAIIPAAGLGTRFLPATKAQPKEMLPIVDKPTIQYIVEEAVESGIEDIIIISGRGKRAIEDHFDKSYELEETLAKKEKFAMLKEVQEISNMVNIHYIRQKEALGLGHAIYVAHRFIGDEPFAVLLGDDIVKSDVPCTRQLMDVYEKYETSIVGVQKVDRKDVSKYGIIAPSEKSKEESVISIETLVEKPKMEEAPSQYAIMGRYILTPDIFPVLQDLPVGSGGEIQLTDAMNHLNEVHPILAYNFSGKRYDVGDKLGFIKATIDFALGREDLQGPVFEYLNGIVNKHQQ
ncbi:UTP--glucose-1-phosphate uridylyltransferase GalU [Lederbergia citri]|uniref:UTP--glucose-1-phosphate uridylyltransferase n=1 Tax=Lederbergia citri TaxID=2833580 RepID=A0A942TDP8_9BACI|nr:UTP--glucose-1-phosphate uridylyltransferase GalU [Lederbergia citri]MBS4195803.1 UTP--glucose-1-phosphate uridylyltransferase GalU [Lederbergia citri]